MGLRPDARMHSSQGHSVSRLRRSKLIAALAVTALVGVGSYTMTYRALEVVSTPTSPAGTTAPLPTTTVPAPT